MITIYVEPLGQLQIDEIPDRCPFCHRSIEPVILYGHRGYQLQIFMACPNAVCRNSFISYYEIFGSYSQFSGVSKGNIIDTVFEGSVNNISPAFSTIYNQAHHAEEENLFEICGVGYRKALEFLIKDYLIFKEPDNKNVIEKKLLGKCIDDHVSDPKIKSVAKRAVWLGNDETHYIKKWEGKTLTDLKKLIDLTIHWMQMELLTESFLDNMPE